MTISVNAAYDAFQAYESIKLHFTSPSYDYFRYGGKIRGTIQSFDRRRDKYQFYKLSKRTGVVDYVATAFFLSQVGQIKVKWVGDIVTQEVATQVAEFQRGANNVTYTVEADLARFGSLDDALAARPDNLFELWKRGDASAYSIIAIDYAVGTLLNYWSTEYTDMFDQRKLDALSKFRPFVPIDAPKINQVLTTYD